MNSGYLVFKTEFGWFGMVKEKGSLVEVMPFIKTEEEANSCIDLKYGNIIALKNAFKVEKETIKRYILGEMVAFDFPLNVSMYSSFQRRVWKITQKIPYGEIRTYGWISKMLKNPRACRAVGSALGKNPLPIVIPCHRVVRRNGELGGYSAPGGKERKRTLLELEGRRFDSKGRAKIFY